MQRPPKKKRKHENDTGKKRKKQKEEKEVKPSLSLLHQRMLNVILSTYIDESALSELKPKEQARLLYLMLYPDDVSSGDALFFKSKDCLDNIIFIHKIFLHEHPQNRVSGDPGAFAKEYLKGRDPVTPEEKKAFGRDPNTGMFVGTGVFNNTVYYFTDQGFPGPVLQEPQGLLALTTEVIDPEVSKPLVIEYINYTISAKLAMLPSPEPAEFKDQRFNKPILQTLDSLLAKGALTLDYIDKHGIDATLTAVEFYNHHSKIKTLIDKDIIPILDIKAMDVIEKGLDDNEKKVTYFLKHGIELYSEEVIIQWSDRDLIQIARLYYEPNVRQMIEFQIENNPTFDIQELLEEPEINIVRIANTFAKKEIFELINSHCLDFQDFYDQYHFYSKVLDHPTARDFFKKKIFSHEILQIFSYNSDVVVRFCHLMDLHPRFKFVLEKQLTTIVTLDDYLRRLGVEETLKIAEFALKYHHYCVLNLLSFDAIATLSQTKRNIINDTLQLVAENKLQNLTDLLLAQGQLTFSQITQYGPHIILRAIAKAQAPQYYGLIINSTPVMSQIIADTILEHTREKMSASQPDAKRKPS